MSKYNLQLVDKGATADLFDIGDGKLFKKFHDDKPDSSIDNEYECTVKVQDFNLGAPKLYGKVNDENGRGFLMEFIHGENMMHQIFEKGPDCEELIINWARIHHKVNSVHTKAFDTAHNIFSWRIQNSNSFNDCEKKSLLSLLSSLPMEDCLCHTDLHPGNIILTDAGPRIIDWCDAMSASKWSDVARIMLFFEQVDIPPQFDINQVKQLFAAGKALFLKEYERLAGSSREELEKWTLLLAASRLDSETPGNKEVYRNMINSKGGLS